MREIKFRAWIKFLQKMARVTEFYPDAQSVLTNGYDYALAKDDVHLMQYTGLKDKNGIEIYEGDVVHDGEDYYQIEYSDCVASFITTGGSDDDLMCATHNLLFEVVGNIHQNPELLSD